MCFVWISEQTAIISLYNINWLVFITEAVCVYSAVRTGSLNQPDIFWSLKDLTIPCHLMTTDVYCIVSVNCSSCNERATGNFSVELCWLGFHVCASGVASVLCLSLFIQLETWRHESMLRNVFSDSWYRLSLDTFGDSGVSLRTAALRSSVACISVQNVARRASRRAWR
jgi:hypothetical protein